MIIFIHGKDTYRSQKRVDQLKKVFVEKYNKSGLNIVVLTGSEITLDEFRSKCFAGGLLEKKRLIVIKNLISQNNDQNLLKGVLDLLKKNKLPEDNILIFWEGSLEEAKKPTKGSKSIKTEITKELLKNKAEEFAPLPTPKLKKWLQAEIKHAGAKIEKQALEELILRIGDDLWKMNNEMEKLVNYCDGRPITEEDVHYFVQSKFDENIFHLTDALGNRQNQLALKLIHDQLSSGTEPLALLSKFIWQFRNLLQINELIGLQNSPDQIAKDLQLHPFVVKKSIPQAKKFSQEKLKKIYAQIQNIDFKLKNTNASPELLFDLLVMEVCK